MAKFAHARKFTVTFAATIVAFVLGIALASGLGTAFAGGNADTTTNQTTGSATVAEPAYTDLATGKVYLRSLTMGALMSPEQEAQLLAEAKTSEWSNTKFTQLATDGHEVVDPKTGITFVIQSYKNEPNFVDGITRIYDVKGIALDDLATDGHSDDDFYPAEEVETSFGTIIIYRQK